MGGGDNDSPNVRLIKDLVSGTIAGWAQVLVGQPFDTVKVRLQTIGPGSQNSNQMVVCVKDIIKNEGYSGFYKGTLAPLIGIGACVSVQFAALSQAKLFFSSLKSTVNKELSSLDIFLSGCFAGLVNAPLSTVIELLRIKAQTHTTSQKGLMEIVSEVFKSGGGPLALYKGWNATLLREIPGFGIYFLAYESAIRYYCSGGKSINELSKLKILSSGAFGGLTMWIICYPLDLVKSKIQHDSFQNPKYKSTWDCFKTTYKTERIHGFYKGLLPCIIRSLPVNAATFSAYELTMRLAGGRNL